MCGIVGAVSSRNIVPVLVEGLKRLEYRGYDSCGVAVHQDGELRRTRSTSRVAELGTQIAQEMGMSKSSVFSALKTLGAPRLRRRVATTKVEPAVVGVPQGGHTRRHQRASEGRENIQVGALTEAVVTAELLRLGATVLHPWGGGTCYDIVAHLPSGKFVRIQCKTARPIKPQQSHVLVFNGFYQAPAGSDGRRDRKLYSADQIDGFAVWSPSTSHLMWVPVGFVQVKLPSFNLDENKRGWKGLTHPDEFPFDTILK